MKKDSYIFYATWWEMLRDTDRDTRDQVVCAINRYVFEGIVAELPPLASGIFMGLRCQIDMERECYEAISRKRAEAGRKHSGNQYTRLEQNGTNGTIVPIDDFAANAPAHTRTQHSDSIVIDNKENNIVSCCEKSKTSEIVAPSGATRAQDNPSKISKTKEQMRADTAARAKEFGRELIPYVDMYGREMIRAFYDYWTEPNKSGSKFRKELEKTWDTARRLATWSNREKVKSNGNNQFSDADKFAAAALGVTVGFAGTDPFL